MLHVCVCFFNCIYVMCCLAGVINDDDDDDDNIRCGRSNANLEREFIQCDVIGCISNAS